ncbi:ribonuclease 2-like [Silene latifolia]|uniref:ribonuclease 2-like n=1 Tax=Silene latifolia TaxID=37657 RepID=UPI003D7892FD
MAKLFAFTITIIALFSVSPSSASFVDDDGGIEVHNSNQREFDYFVLALQWPGTYCRRTQKCCKTNGCCRSSGAPQHFTIHGLWADYNDGGWPACCSNDSFDMNEISTLEKALYEYWPTLSCGSTSTCHGSKGSFYAHEWEKHGTCSASVTGDEYNYFLTTLNIYFKYNVTEVLREAGYVPSNSEKYPLGGVITAIENAFHTTPSISCSKGAIQEIHLCFYKDFKPRDCATRGVKTEINLSKSSCPKYVSLPEYVSSGRLTKGETFSQLRPDVASQ